MSEDFTQEIEQLSHRIKEVRKQKKLTQERVAELMDIDDGTYRRIESGRTSPTYKTIIRLCKALDISLSEFFSTL